MNRLFWADAADLCAAGDDPFDLVYLDPPYSVGTTMACRESAGQMRGRKQPKSGRHAYDDRSDPEALVAHLAPRLAALRDRMSDKATLYLHLDYRAVHEAKVAADRIFGRSCFLGEICWAPGNGARGARGFAVTHQTLLLYAKKGRRHVVHHSDHPLLREPYAATSLAMHFTKRDEDGRRYRERRVAGKTYRYYADEGRRLGSVWTDIPAMVANTPLRKEGTGYPTQKPEKLLERILRMSSDPGDHVVDPMCGSGTTLVVAARLDRRFTGGDQSEVAIELTRERLDEAGVAYAFESRAASASASRMPAGEAVPSPARS
ncbi:MAG: site-specific DNA-methyltransferase [Myxococcales bacterium]|nr:site-specific DNA-methyltransferase [Myxococcales bacterium]